MERTKTPKQIADQWHKVSDYCKRRGCFQQVQKVAERYLTNAITHTNPFGVKGEKRRWNRFNRPVPVSVYAKQTEV